MPATPLVTTISPREKPTTVSVNVMVHGIGDALVAGDSLDVRVTPGFVVSITIARVGLSAGVAMVRVAVFVAASRNDPPFVERAPLALTSRSVEFSPAPTVY